jgi:agmatinase
VLLDCGDVPISAFDNAKAIDQMEAAYSTLLGRPVQGGATAAFAIDGKEHPRLVTLGGDHTIVAVPLRFRWMELTVCDRFSPSYAH